MSDETLQNDEVVETTEIETTEVVNTSELAPEAETTEQTQVDEEAEKKAKAQAAFNKQYGATKQAERERDALQVELDKVNQVQNTPPPEVGSFPQEFDYDTPEQFEQAKTAFVNNVKANERFQANQDALVTQQQNSQLAAQQQQQVSDNEMANKLIEQAKANNISELQVQQDTAAVINYGIQADTYRAIAHDQDGSLMLKHLAGNSQEVAALSLMNPVEQGAYIANVLKPKAVALKPKTSQTPTPATDVTGTGVDPDANKYPELKGVTYS